MARRSDHTREELIALALDSAEHLLAEKRLRDISARQIAKSMGYTVGTLYTLFTNLDDLFIHILGRFLDRLYRSCQNALEHEADPLARICLCGRVYLRSALEQPHTWEMLFSNELRLGENHNWVGEKTDLLFSMLNQLLAELAPDKSTDDIQEGGRMLWGCVHGITVLSLQDRISGDLSERTVLMDKVIGCFIRGWR